MSVSAPPQPGAAAPARTGAGPGSARPAGDACPLCGAPLQAEQDWCLRCGAAARTRLASSPNWRLPVAVVAVVGALALGLLAVALVKLAGGSGNSQRPAAAGQRPTPANQTGTPPGAAGAGLGASSTPTAPVGPAATAPSATSSVPAPATGGGAAHATPGAGAGGASPTTPVPPTAPTGTPPASRPGATSPKLSRAEQERLRKLLRRTR